VVARSFERIHRSNLVGMGVLPLQFHPGDSWQSLGLDGSEMIDLVPEPNLRPQSEATMVITRADGTRQEVGLTLRIDTPIEVAYYRHGGILPYVLRGLLAPSSAPETRHGRASGAARGAARGSRLGGRA
jgi:aconitate hydratase